MSIRVRLILILLLVGLLPMLLTVFEATRTLTETRNLALERSRVALEEAGEQAIREKAVAVARQIEIYLDLHPEIDLADTSALEANLELAAIAVQPVGETGYSAVFDAQAITHFHANPDIVGMDMSTLADPLPEFWGIFAAALDGSFVEGYYDWQEADGSIRPKFMAIAPVGDTPLRVAATTYIAEFSQPALMLTAELEQLSASSNFRLALITVAISVVAIGIALVVGTWFATPIREMAQVATQVMEGNWDATRPSRRRDELGVLNRTLNSMTAQLQESIEGLEKRVVERTRELEQRSRYLEAAAEVARAAALILEMDELIQQVVGLIRERFSLYYVGLFMVDEAGEWATLQAGTGEAGQVMLARHHRIRVGEGMIGWCITNAQARVALEAGRDAVRLATAELPETRSEAALPLRSRGRVIGAFSVQSDHPNAFDEETIVVLQIMADQVAVALDNAGLFAESQNALDAMRLAYGEVGREAWERIARDQADMGYLADSQGVRMTRGSLQPEMIQASRDGQTVQTAGQTVAIPIKTHDHVVGVVRLRKPDEDGDWTADEVEMMEMLAEQLSVALESARLYQDTQRRAIHDRLVGEVTSRMRETLDVETVLQTAIREIGESLNLAEVEVRIGDGPVSGRV